MIASWMLYCVLCGLGLSLAAVLAERALVAGRGPVRFVWIGAVALSLVVPVVAYRVASQPAPAATSAPVVSAVAPPVVIDPVGPTTAPVVRASSAQQLAWDWRAAFARADRPLAIVWIAMSSVLALYFAAGIFILAWMRQRWSLRAVLGVPVFVSERIGPALVGTLSPAIVVPEWALAMDPAQLALMLRHEEEHRRAGDGQILAAAQLALIAMPWNVALWWQVVRLRLAVELDCDARVLRDVDARVYGDLLLEVARPRRAFRLMGATAFAERATQLERRIRVMSRHRVHTSRRARAAAAGIALVSVSVAWVAPHPSAPPRPQSATKANTASADSMVARDTLPHVVARTTQPLATPPSVLRDTLPPVVFPRTGDTVQRSVRALRPVSIPPVVAPIGTETRFGGPVPAMRSGTPRSEFVDSVFNRLFNGITLTAEQEARARALLANLERQQIAQDQIALGSAARDLARRNAFQAERDSTLRALLTSDADRAVLDVRLAPPVLGRGGRGGGRGALADTAARRLGAAVPTDSAIGRGAARGAGGGARGGGGRGQAQSVSSLAEATFNRLFNGITLTPDQESTARAAIVRAQEGIVSLTPQRYVRVAMGRGGPIVVLQAQSDSALAALLDNDGDRAMLRSRIANFAILPAPISTRPPQP